MNTLYIVIPAYNEEATILSVINQWYPIVEKVGGDSRLVIVNDGSKDSTLSLVQQAAIIRPRLVPLDKENGGHGAAVLFGYQYALEHGADYVFQTDSDGQTLPEEFQAFWEQRQDYDLIIGHRKGRQDGLSRVVVTKTLKAVIAACFGVSVRDANTPYRLMSAQTLRENIRLIPEGFNLSNVILTVVYTKKKMRILYIPITFQPRQGGVNSINLPKICKIGAKALSDFRKINREINKAIKE